MADVTGIQSKQDITFYGIETTGNVAKLGRLNNTENTEYDKVETKATGKESNQQNGAQRLFDPHSIFISV